MSGQEVPGQDEELGGAYRTTPSQNLGSSSSSRTWAVARRPQSSGMAWALIWICFSFVWVGYTWVLARATALWCHSHTNPYLKHMYLECHVEKVNIIFKMKRKKKPQICSWSPFGLFVDSGFQHSHLGGQICWGGHCGGYPALSVPLSLSESGDMRLPSPEL